LAFGGLHIRYFRGIGRGVPGRYFRAMRSASHEKKILENIQRLTFCTECLEDFLDYSLIPFGSTWKYLCWKCYRDAVKQAREKDALSQTNSTARRKSDL